MERITVRTVDLETTDFPPEGGVIELGYVDSILERDNPDNPWRVADPIANRFQKFFDPGPDKKMTLEALATHHIKEHEYRGQTPASELNDYVYEGGPNILVAHAADFEKSFIENRNPIYWIDTHKVALRLYADFKRHSNQYLRYALDLDLSDAESHPPHRAQPDAYTTAHLFHVMLAGAPLRTMIEWSAKPPYLTKFTFGKHFGKKFEEVEKSYLQWILGQDFDEGTKAACRRVLYGEE